VPAPNLHTGVTFEVNLGVGWVNLIKLPSGETQFVATNGGRAGVDLGVGGWLRPKLALTGRAAGVHLTDSESSDRCVQYFIGPSLQYWVDDRFWLGGGLGVSTLFAISRSREGSAGPTSWGVGLDLRAGYAVISGTQSSVNISIEANTGFYSIDKGLGTSLFLTATGLALLIGYQHL
jgi:hypothetical protein